MKYIYILQSVKNPEQIHSGITDDMDLTVSKHNGRQVAETAKFAPWNLRTFLVFSDEAQARSYDHYLKTEDGLNYIKKRL